jgi:hypothetical protein
MAKKGVVVPQPTRELGPPLSHKSGLSDRSIKIAGDAYMASIGDGIPLPSLFGFGRRPL